MAVPYSFYGPHEVWGERARAEVERHPNFPKLLTTLRAMKEAASQKGVRITIVILPTKGEVYRWVLSPQSSDGGRRPSGFAGAVLVACRQISLRCWYSKLFLQGEAQRLFASSHDLLWWRDDTHMNELGHQAIASFVAQEIMGKRSRTPVGNPSAS